MALKPEDNREYTTTEQTTTTTIHSIRAYSDVDIEREEKTIVKR